MRRRDCGSVLMLGAACAHGATAQAATLRLRVPDGLFEGDERDSFLQKLLVLALEATGHGVELERVRGLGTSARLQALVDNTLDVANCGSVNTPGKEVLVLRSPIRRGLLGLRLLLVTQERQAEFLRLRTLEQLKRYRMGYGQDWVDRQRLQDLGFKLDTSVPYADMFRALAQGKLDVLNRGVNEVWAEVDHPLLVPTKIVVLPRIALFYPLDDYFCINPRQPQLRDALAEGMKRIRQDRRYGQLFRAAFGRSLERADLGRRVVWSVAGYGIDADTPLQEFDVLSLQATRARAV